jgi:DNA-directed RNA polymerase subunit RPC12/RpoP
MKFLCVTCDSQMKSLGAQRQEDGTSLSLVLECPDCGSRMGLLTNPMETKILDSLDVSLCPVGGKTQTAEETEKSPATDGESKCPFSDRIAADDERLATGEGELVTWTDDAESRLANIPSFVRPMARRGIEMFAREQGHGVITLEVMDSARDVMGM